MRPLRHHAAQRGIAVLAVAVLLVVAGALAFMLSRQGAMAANAVNSQYDTEAARYLAEAGLNVAEWRAWQIGCGKRDTLVKASRIDANGTYSAFIKDGDKKLIIDAVGTTEGGARVAVNRKDVLAHEKDPRELIIGADKGQDTFISAATPTQPQHGQRYLELTQRTSSALVQFDLPGEMTRGTVLKAELTLTLYQSNSALPGQAISARRLTRKWDPDPASWNNAQAATPWFTAGGDTVATVVPSVTIGGAGAYTFDITALVDGWANNAFPNFGVLLQADGPLQQARFYGLQSLQGKPTLRVLYYKIC